MKFNEFKKIREKAIEINGLNESADLNEYKDSIHEAIEAVNEMEDIGDFFFGHLKAMKSLGILRARYPMIAKRKNNIVLKAYEKVKSIEHKAKDKREAYRDSLEQKWRDKINKLPLEKREIAREAMKNDVNGKIDLFNQKVDAEVKKVNIKSRNAENSVSDKWDRIQGRNELPRKVWSDRWTASKARLDGNYEVDLIEGKIEIEERYNDKESGSMDQQIERLRKKAQKEKADSEVKAKEAEARAKAEEEEQFDELDDNTKEALKELQPILNDFINAISKYESIATDIENSYGEIDNEKDDYNKLSSEEKEESKEEYKETISKLKSDIKSSNAELIQSRKDANLAKSKLDEKKDAAKKAGFWESIQKQIAAFNSAQENHKRNIGSNVDDTEEPKEKEVEETPKEKESDEELSPAAKKLKDEIKDLKDALEEIEKNPKKNSDKIGVLKISITNKQKQLDKLIDSQKEEKSNESRYIKFDEYLNQKNDI